MQTYGPPGFVPSEFRWEEGQDKKVGGEENPRILLLDLFVPYAQVRDEDLRTLVAILQNANIANYLKETGSKLSNLLTKKLNQAWGFFGQEALVPEVEIRKVSDLINAAAQNLRGCTRQELITLFQAELAKRARMN